MDVHQKIRSATEAPSASIRLSSWKEIAVYLNRDPRTVQMWEKGEGLPVHRLTHQARASVYAYTSEIDAWMHTRAGKSPAGSMGEPASASGHRPFFKRRQGISLLLVVLALVVVAVLLLRAAAHRKTQAASPSPVPVLAVLPIEDQTSSDGALGDSLTGSLIADFGRIGKVTVISPHSVLQFKGQHLPLPQIAAELHASLVLRGTVAKTPDQLTVTVELLDAPRDAHLWGTTYTRKDGDRASLLNEISSGIAAEVTRRITGSAPAVLPVQAADPKAMQANYTARCYWNQRDLPSLEKAILFFQKAIAIDPKYAAAYAGLAETYDLMTDRGVLADAEAFNRAKAAAHTALTLDPANANAYNALAFAAYRQDWDFGRAEQYFKKAVSLNPNSAVAHQWYGEFLGDMRRFDQSIAELRKAGELDPLSPMVGSDLADGYLHAGRLAEADAELKRILDLYPDFAPAHLYRVSVYSRRADFAGAENEAKAYQRLTHDKTPLQIVEIQRLAAAGDLARSGEQLRQLLNGASGRSFSAYRVAQLYFSTGQNELGYAALDKAYRDRSWWLVTMLVDPGFDPVRSQPRFLEVAHRVGLPDAGGAPQMAYQPQNAR